ncbi:hypothetical protein B0G80_4857 [Paraburkholderia sp. BL6669N2]|nr:hypothetical protein B0G80_4857 [Paraburkholderia sp. BL6669N2]
MIVTSWRKRFSFVIALLMLPEALAFAQSTPNRTEATARPNAPTAASAPPVTSEPPARSAPTPPAPPDSSDTRGGTMVQPPGPWPHGD